jgi:hypothetical protein
MSRRHLDSLSGGYSAHCFDLVFMWLILFDSFWFVPLWFVLCFGLLASLFCTYIFWRVRSSLMSQTSKDDCDVDAYQTVPSKHVKDRFIWECDEHHPERLLLPFFFPPKMVEKALSLRRKQAEEREAGVES